jgi:RNA polymerase sigma-70 factor (TIGR02943 family)
MTEQKEHILKPESWVANYSDYLYNYAFYRVNDEALAEDMVQETFLAGLNAMKNFEGRSSEKTWLVSILKRKIIDYYRKKSTTNEQNIIDKNSAEGFDSPFMADGFFKGNWIDSRAPVLWDMDTIQSLSAEEFMLVLNKCISRLPDKMAATFTLKLIEEVDSEKICKELDISASNLWVILHRARTQVRECLEKNWINS